MELYILDRKNLETLSITQPVQYELNLDEETNGVSTFVLTSLNGAKKGNIVVLNGFYKQFLFVIKDVTIENNLINLLCLDISNIFNRKVIERDIGWMTFIGIEYFVRETIKSNFINRNDPILAINYFDIVAKSYHKVNVVRNAENNLYNFHTFLINCRQYQNIYTEFSLINTIQGKQLHVEIKYKEEKPILIDTTVDEVINYNKVYEVDPVTKVEAYIQEDGSTYNLYLKKDRTTTTDINDVDRLEGRIETISSLDLETAKEEALNIIKANRYKHLVEFSIPKTSKLIDVTELTIGRPILIKTKDSVYESYISSIQLTDNNFISYKSGNLRVDFTDKQRQEKLKEV